MNTRIIRAALVATLGLAATASFADSASPFQGEAAWAPRGEYAGTSVVQPNLTELRQTPVPAGYQAAVAYEPRGEYAKQEAAPTPVLAEEKPVIAQFAAPYQGEAAWAPRGGRS
ncbi:hypothetical protein [Niveibacterium sp. SC-1]|uniref:hypothetical protein n=1 Tax=Niveibacterium sp. SC-1 TaxID=3135646 RepID=UPI00311E602C